MTVSECATILEQAYRYDSNKRTDIMSDMELFSTRKCEMKIST